MSQKFATLRFDAALRHFPRMHFLQPAPATFAIVDLAAPQHRSTQ